MLGSGNKKNLDLPALFEMIVGSLAVIINQLATRLTMHETRKVTAVHLRHGKILLTQNHDWSCISFHKRLC